MYLLKLPLFLGKLYFLAIGNGFLTVVSSSKTYYCLLFLWLFCLGVYALPYEMDFCYFYDDLWSYNSMSLIENLDDALLLFIGWSTGVYFEEDCRFIDFFMCLLRSLKSTDCFLGLVSSFGIWSPSMSLYLGAFGLFSTLFVAESLDLERFLLI